MTKDEMVEWFKSAPKDSHERMLWAARKIAGLTGATEGRAYQMLLVARARVQRRGRIALGGLSSLDGAARVIAKQGPTATGTAR